MGKWNHSYGHFVFSDLKPGTFSLAKILNVPGVVPLFEKQKAPLRLMSWCTYRMSDSSKELLQVLSTRCGEPTTTDAHLVSIAQSGLPTVDTVPLLKGWLLNQLLCHVDGRVLPNYCGVLGEFLLNLPLPRIIYMLDYYLPQLQPWDKGSLNELSTMAAPIHFCPQKMYMYFQRRDDEFCYCTFVNEGGTPFVMTPTNAQKCFHTIDYVKKFEGKPLEVGRVVAIVFHLGGQNAALCVVIGIVMDCRPRGRAKWLNDTIVSPQERGYGITHHKCNPRSLDLALLQAEAAQVFCDSIPENIHVREVFAIGHTRTAKELTAVAQIPSSRIVRGLGLLTENVSADAISPPRKATLQSLLCRLLRRMLTPWHIPMPDIKYDSWFRTKVLPIAADEDGHVVAATSAVALALATGKLNVCVQSLFGAGKSRAAAILLLGLMALDTEGECHFQVVCKENTGARSFIEMVEYLEFPTEMYKRIGRIVSDREAQNAASTYFDIRHSARSERLQQCRLLVMTGGSFANDRCSTFPTLDTWLSKLMLTIFDEAQQFGGDREVTTIAMLPPTCLVVWMGDAQQTPGGIAKGQDQFAISRKQLMMRPAMPAEGCHPSFTQHCVVCPSPRGWWPVGYRIGWSVSLCQQQLRTLIRVDHPDQDQSATLDILDTFCPGGALRWKAPSTQDIQTHPTTSNVLVPSDYAVYRRLHLFCTGSGPWMASSYTGEGYLVCGQCGWTACMGSHASHKYAHPRSLLRLHSCCQIWPAVCAPPGHPNMAHRHTYTRRCRRISWRISIGALETTAGWTRVCASHRFITYYQKCVWCTPCSERKGRNTLGHVCQEWRKGYPHCVGVFPWTLQDQNPISCLISRWHSYDGHGCSAV